MKIFDLFGITVAGKCRAGRGRIWLVREQPPRSQRAAPRALSRWRGLERRLAAPTGTGGPAWSACRGGYATWCGAGRRSGAGGCAGWASGAGGFAVWRSGAGGCPGRRSGGGGAPATAPVAPAAPLLQQAGTGKGVATNPGPELTAGPVVLPGPPPVPTLSVAGACGSSDVGFGYGASPALL